MAPEMEGRLSAGPAACGLESPAASRAGLCAQPPLPGPATGQNSDPDKCAVFMERKALRLCPKNPKGLLDELRHI